MAWPASDQASAGHRPKIIPTLSTSGRQRNGYARPAAGPLVDANGAPVCRNDLGHNCQPEAGTARLAGSVGVNTDETIEYPSPVCRRNPGTVVANGQHNLFTPRCDGDLYALLRMTDVIVEQVAQHAGDATDIANEARLLEVGMHIQP